jgi:hypothetical protein
MIIPFPNPRRKQLRRGGARADLVMSGLLANNSERDRATLVPNLCVVAFMENRSNTQKPVYAMAIFGVLTVLGILPSFMMC